MGAVAHSISDLQTKILQAAAFSSADAPGVDKSDDSAVVLHDLAVAIDECVATSSGELLELARSRLQ